LSQKFLGGDGGLHDFIWRMPRENLISWAFSAERYHRQVNNQQGLRGGLVDYIFNLSNQEIVSHILKETEEHPEINSKDKLDSLSIEFGFANVNVQGPSRGGDGGLHDYIWRLPREKLINWALTSEAYHRDVNHLHLLGGLDDYVNSLTNDKIIEYIMNEVKEHPELTSQGKLDTLSTKYNINVNSVHNVQVASPFGGDGGIHDYIWRMDRPSLNKWALTTEKYHRNTNNQQLFGGLHDYISTLSNQQVIDYIMKEVKEHPELTAGKIDSLSAEYGITGEVEKPLLQMGGNDGGLHDYIWRLPRTTLDSWALAAEKYHNKEQITLGGLHDYIATLSNQQVIEYIMKEVKEHPEIASGNKLDALVTKYTTPVVNSGPIMGGGLHDVVRALDRQSLIAYALAMDEYSHEKSPRLGGIHDYVNTLQDEEIRNFILKQAETFPELNNRIAVEGLVKKYNIKN
jgi:HD superfamily phosphohydrolase YqeK